MRPIKSPDTLSRHGTDFHLYADPFVLFPFLKSGETPVSGVLCLLQRDDFRNQDPRQTVEKGARLMDRPMTILFAGGGTGGHLFPGIAVAKELQRRFPQVQLIFAGSERSIESTIVAENHLEHRMLPVESLSTLKRNPFRFVWRNWRAWRTSKKWMKQLRPAAVIGLGGIRQCSSRLRRQSAAGPDHPAGAERHPRPDNAYTQPVCGQRLYLVRRGEEVPATSSANSVTGNPVRAEIARLHDRHHAAMETPSSSQQSPPQQLPEELLILGGSQGADSLNAAVLKAISAQRDTLTNWKITHQTGPRDVETARQVYEEIGLQAVVAPFFHEMSGLYDRASLVISRSGATTLAELACAGKAMILLPYPHAADAHQLANANVFVERQAAVLVEHAQTPDETASALARELERLLSDSELRKRMGNAAYTLAHPMAAGQIADVIEAEIQRCSVSVAKQHDSERAKLPLSALSRCVQARERLCESQRLSEFLARVRIENWQAIGAVLSLPDRASGPPD